MENPTNSNLNGERRSIGNAFETRALEHLQRHGLRLLHRHYHSRLGEIDLILQDKKTVVFVEVRSRRATRYGHPLETIHYHKQQRIIKTAQLYLLSHYGIPLPLCRFDVVTFVKDELQWIKNAFSS